MMLTKPNTSFLNDVDLLGFCIKVTSIFATLEMWIDWLIFLLLAMLTWRIFLVILFLSHTRFLLPFCVQKPPEGLSGKLTFNRDGTRKGYLLYVYSMALDKGVKKVIFLFSIFLSLCSFLSFLLFACVSTVKETKERLM